MRDLNIDNHPVYFSVLVRVVANPDTVSIANPVRYILP